MDIRDQSEIQFDTNLSASTCHPIRLISDLTNCEYHSVHPFSLLKRSS